MEFCAGALLQTMHSVCMRALSIRGGLTTVSRKKTSLFFILVNGLPTVHPKMRPKVCLRLHTHCDQIVYLNYFVLKKNRK